MTDSTDSSRVERAARLRWIAFGDMHVAVGVSQREKGHKEARVNYLLAHLDLEQIGAPVLSLRDGAYFIIDGQHRIEALRRFGFTPADKLQCWVYEGLTQSQEGEKFLQYNDILPVSVMDKFRVGVNANREMESDIDRIVQAQGLRVSLDKGDGAIMAVGTLRRIYRNDGAKTLARTLRIVRDAYGDAGLKAPVLNGIGLLCARYNGELQDELAVTKLSNLRGGVHGLLNEAEKIRLKTGNAKGHCVAAAAVDIINTGRRNNKLPSWWTEQVAS